MSTTSSISTEDLFERLPDPLLLLVLNKITDVKSLGRCSLVSGRFHSLVSQVDSVLVRVDCIISEPHSPHPHDNKPRSLLSHLARLVLSCLVRPLLAFGLLLGPASPTTKRSCLSARTGDSPDVSHHSPAQVLKNFRELKHLKIELPTGELGVDHGVLLRWNAEFGSTLESCVILGASSVTHSQEGLCAGAAEGPDSFYENGGLKLRVVWTISSLIAASARHYLLRQIIAEHGTLESLELVDADRQGVLKMDRRQLEELRVKPVSLSSGASQRTLVPALNMRLWYASRLELSGGVVLEGATLVAIRPAGLSKEEAAVDGGWVSSAFEEPYATAVRLLMKRKTYCLEMNSF